MPGPGGVQNETDVNRFALLRCVELGVCESFRILITPMLDLKLQKSIMF